MPDVRPARRVLLAGGLGAAAAAALPVPAYASAAEPVVLRLAGPAGPAPVGAVELHLVDRSRTDPWTDRPRELMATVAYPAVDVRDRPLLPWLPPGAERALKARYGGALDGYAFPWTHSADRAPARPGRRPVLLYSPGAASDRTFNTLVVEELVSWGYVVVTVDHPHDSGEVEFPDGRVVLSAGEGAAPRRRSPPRSRCAPPTCGSCSAHWPFCPAAATPMPSGAGSRAGCARPWTCRAWARSATPGAVPRRRPLMDLDPGVRAGADLDGTVFGPVVGRGLDRPFLLMDTAVHDGLNKDPYWPEFWRNLRGWRRCLRLADAGHHSFTDLVALAPQLPPGPPLQVGTIAADRAVAAVRATVRAFFDIQLRGRPDTGHLLDGASRRHPEVGYVAG
ncbi:lipase [Streptomyces tricolor]|nr:lipase [Streptomyces tricolor]